MSLHPLLRDLQTNLKCLKATKIEDNPHAKITDANPHLVSLCKGLEAMFQHGLLPNDNVFVLFEVISLEPKREAGMNALVKHIVSEIKKIRTLKTDLGRSRYFFRCCLNNGWLTSLVISLRNWKSIGDWYQSDSLLLRNPNESIMSILPDLDLLHFDLHLANRSFLDDSWELPIYNRFELIPGSDLGLMICSVQGKIVVTKVKPYSSAGEDGKVQVGDVIDDIDATPTYGLEPEAIAKIVKKCGKRPLAIGVVKAEKNGQIFPPLKVLLEQTSIDLKRLEEMWSVRKKWRPNSLLLDDDNNCPGNDGNDEFDPLLEDEEDFRYNIKGGAELLYIGSLKVGNVGDASLLDKAIHRVIHDQKKVHHSVRIYLQELGIKMFCNEKDKEILNYTYPEISACGCCSTDNHYLAFIAGNDLCTMATEFMCHVFYCANQAKARDVISTIAEGFERTQNAV